MSFKLNFNQNNKSKQFENEEPIYIYISVYLNAYLNIPISDQVILYAGVGSEWALL